MGMAAVTLVAIMMMMMIMMKTTTRMRQVFIAYGSTLAQYTPEAVSASPLTNLWLYQALFTSCNRAFDDQYLAGLWKSHLPAALLWHRMFDDSRRPSYERSEGSAQRERHPGRGLLWLDP